jgi:hypothetical protein
MPTFEETLKEKGKKNEFKPLKDIPSEIKAKWILEEYKKDQTNRECLFVVLTTEAGEMIKQKYTSTMYQTLAEDIESCGGLEQLKNGFFTYKKKEVGKKGSFERLYPTPQDIRKKKA